MARGKRMKGKLVKKPKEVKGKVKEESARHDSTRRAEEKSLNRPGSCFRSEEVQEIRQVINFDEFNQDHRFLGAVVIGKFDVVKKMLKEGYNINSMDENRESALMLTVKLFRLDMVEFLVRRGADVSLLDSEGNNALQLAAQSPLWDQDSFSGLWRSVSDRPNLRLDHSNKTGHCLLHYVTQRQWLSVLQLLLTHPMSVDCRTNKGVTPLIMAASMGDSCSIQVLLEAGADVTLEDQQNCTALCYAIVDRLKKNTEESDRALELLLAALNDEQSKTTLELYLERRLMLIISPPMSRAEFVETVSSVIGKVLTFYARFIYSGLDLLLELRLFHRLAESLVIHMEDPVYTTAVLNIVSELVRRCDCCSQVEVADAFISAGFGKISLDILNKYGTGKTGMIKAVFLPLLTTCTSNSYLARVWLEKHHVHLQTFYNKYTRSFPAAFKDACGDKHLQAENQCGLSFQDMMKTLKNNGRIVTKEEHTRAFQKLKQAHMCKISRSCTPSERQKKTKPSAVYNSVIQFNFEKLDIIQNRKQSPKSPSEPQKTTKPVRKESLPAEAIPSDTGTEQSPSSERKSRIAIKEIQQHQLGVVEMNLQSDKCIFKGIHTEKAEESSPQKNLGSNSKKDDIKEKFSEGYQLFRMEETSSSEDDSPRDCEWLDANAIGDGNKVVTEAQVASTLKDLEDIFNRIVKRYNSTWLKQYQEGYLGAQGDAEDLLMLMKVLPALEEFHIKKLTEKWSKFCKQIKNHARKNHIIYAATVSEMQLFLLEFESELEKKNYHIFDENDGLQTNSCLSLEITQNSNTKCYETSTALFTNKIVHENNDSLNKSTQENLSLNQNDENENPPIMSLGQSSSFSESKYNSEGEDRSNSIWDTHVQKIVLDTFQLSVDKDVINAQKENSINSAKETVTSNDEGDKEIVPVDFLPTDNDIKVQKELCQGNGTITESLGKINIQDSHQAFCESSSEGSLENIQVPEQVETGNEPVVREAVSTRVKPPPCFDCVIPATSYFNYLASAPNYCGTKYHTLSNALANLPSCQTEQLADGRLKLATIDLQFDFKLFIGFNFGDVELGLNTVGVPLAVRRFQKVKTQCNKLVSSGLVKSVTGMLHLSHPHILPYLASYDLPHSVVYATPLCYNDLGQHIRYLRSSITNSNESFSKFTSHLVTLANQLMLGLHFLHTRDKAIVHGNLKPSNVMVDNCGTLRLAEFGLHEIVFQQRSPAMTSIIWWSRECIALYYSTCKFVCTEKSDMQTAGMLVHFILTFGHHPFGQNIPEITENIKRGVVQHRCTDVIAIDLIYWQLSIEPRHRPTTLDTLRHVLFWSSDKRWDFLLACCGLGPQTSQPLPLRLLYRDLDLVGELRDVNTKWIKIMKENCKANIGTSGFEDKPSGLLRFLRKNLTSWADIKEIFLELFLVLPLNLFRLLEQTEWIHHPQFEPFIIVPT